MTTIIFYSVYVIELLLMLFLQSLAFNWSTKRMGKYIEINKEEWEEFKVKNIELKKKVNNKERGENHN